MQPKNGNFIAAIAVVVAIFVGFQVWILSGVYSDPYQEKFGAGLFGLVDHSGVSSKSGIGKYSNLPLGEDGFNTMVEWDKTITLSDEQKKQFAGFNTRLPCCGFGLTTEDEFSDCRCGHHLAYAGLIKYGLTNGWARGQIQEEIDQWKTVFYPICSQNPKLCDL